MLCFVADLVLIWKNFPFFNLGMGLDWLEGYNFCSELVFPVKFC